MMDEQTRTADALQPTLLYQDDWLVAGRQMPLRPNFLLHLRGFKKCAKNFSVSIGTLLLANWALNTVQCKTVQHQGFPGDHSTQYWSGPTLIEFPVLMRGAAFVRI